MTREHWKELLPIITAFANGEDVELFDEIGNKWGGGEKLAFSEPFRSYRIKPKPREFSAWLSPDGRTLVDVNMKEYGWEPITLIEKL